ncbi:MAG TPA: glycoside hydrolase family 9 protein [Ohtaekwangia sp.]|nr:glycoside hydrolase family 9 protein [Ohtaekwangia sp.]
MIIARRCFVLCFCFLNVHLFAQKNLVINDQEYLEMTGLNVMLAHDFYPESHQGGVGIIQNGLRVATNGDLRLEPAPGQWQPVPKVGTRMVDREKQEISVRMSYPDPEKDRKGFNPIIYPDLSFSYTLKVRPEGKSFRIIVDLDEPLPGEWIGKVGFNFELFPGILFGKSYYMDTVFGIFSQQANGPMFTDSDGELQIVPMAEGKRLVVAPESDRQRMMIENVSGGTLQLIDGRGKHNNGWFVVRSLVAEGATTNAVEWVITPYTQSNWMHEPVVQVSQVGYHPQQPKIANIEIDATDTRRLPASLLRVTEIGGIEKVMEVTPRDWGKFLRYQYLQVDFTAVTKPGMYKVRYGDYETQPFQISENIYKRHVWQPTIEYFLPAQMCHMRINERYRVWHDRCHMDDARMAPLDHNHFDGYIQGPSALQEKYKPGDHVPGLDQGGWHDAGDFDLRIESQAETIHMLSLAYEMFRIDYDNTTIDQQNKVVEIQQPDGKNDFLQQIEHGALPIVAGYRSLGRLYRGVICPTLRQYVLLGDASAMTDNVVFTGDVTDETPAVGLPGSPDDRWVFTEENSQRELQTAAALAATSRALKDFNPTLAAECLLIAQELWTNTKEKNPMQRLTAAVELLRTTQIKSYGEWIVSQRADIVSRIDRTGWVVAPVLALIGNRKFTAEVRKAVEAYRIEVDAQEKKNPFGVPYEPNIWGAGWGIQDMGVKHYFLHAYFPDIFPSRYMLHALNFVLGCHPGTNTASFVSGVGSRSLLTAYGFNRADWSYIPGGVGSGTALIRPDFPELLTWPFLWQQTEYVLGGGTTDYIFLVLAADHVLNKTTTVLNR